MRKGVLFMRKSETQSANAVEKTIAVVLGGLIALGIAVLVLLAAAAAVSAGVLREDTAVQGTAAACIIGCFLGGLITCVKWGNCSLIAGLSAGAACFLLLLAVSLLISDGLELGLHALTELACCLCGGAAAGLLCGRKRHGKKAAVRRKVRA